MSVLDFSAEEQIKLQGFKNICGIDEVGRGPWAGPVVAAAVILNEENLPCGVTDSKKLSPKKRAEFFDFIMKNAIVSIAEASVLEIDKMNIREATFLAMKRALDGLKTKADYAFVDGNVMPEVLGVEGTCVIKGDLKIMSIAAASVVAKVYRDNLMAELAKKYPYYGWEKNAGYGVKVHKLGIETYGITEHHRKSFKPIREAIS